MILTITKGAHWRNTHLPALGEDRQFAHIFDADEPEDVPHQASNFITYANALGHSHGPHVLIGPAGPFSADSEVPVRLNDWQMIVSTATGVQVEIR